MKEKRGQAAMEFLMTYGWAILAAVIVIGVLASFGVFSPGKFMPKALLLNAPFGSDEYGISTANGISIVLRNSGGQDLNVSSLTIANCGSDTTIGLIQDGNTTLVNIPTCTQTLVVGSKFKGDITITYRIVGGTLDQTSPGSLTGTVAA